MTTTSPPTAPKPRRRWLQFSLRTLIVLMLVFGCGFGWLGMKLRQAREQREAVRHLKGLTQLRTLRLTGTEEVTVAGTFALMPYPEGISLRQELWLSDNKVADAGLRDLRGLACLHDLTQLRELRINSTWATDRGLEHLKGLTQLQTLGGLGVNNSTDTVYQLEKALPNVKITR